CTEGRLVHGPCVVDEDMEGLLPLLKRRRQGVDAVEGGEISHQGQAGAEGRQLGGDPGAGLGIAADDVGPGAVGHQAPGDHVADAAGAAGDQGDPTFDGKQIAHGTSSLLWCCGDGRPGSGPTDPQWQPYMPPSTTCSPPVM